MHYALRRSRSLFLALAAGLVALSIPACNSSQTAAPETEQTQAAAPASETAAANPYSAELDDAIAQYKIYITGQVDQMVKANRAFTDAVIAGDLQKARTLYGPTRVYWERSEPIAELFSDLDGSMDAREDDFAKATDDPNFTGYHRLEVALFRDNTTEGMRPIAEKLMADTLDLQKRINDLAIRPKDMVGGAAALVEEIAATKVTGEEDRYARTDLYDFNANLEGSQKIVELLRPMLEKADPALLAQIDEKFATLNQELAKYKTPDGGFVSYEKFSEADRQNLKTVIASLSEDLSQLRGTLGVD